MSEQDKKDIKAVKKIQGWMFYAIVFINAMTDKFLMLVMIFVVTVCALVAAGLVYQLHNGTVIHAALDLIPK